MGHAPRAGGEAGERSGLAAASGRRAAASPHRAAAANKTAGCWAAHRRLPQVLHERGGAAVHPRWRAAAGRVAARAAWGPVTGLAVPRLARSVNTMPNTSIPFHCTCGAADCLMSFVCLLPRNAAVSGAATPHGDVTSQPHHDSPPRTHRCAHCSPRPPARACWTCFCMAAHELADCRRALFW